MKIVSITFRLIPGMDLYKEIVNACQLHNFKAATIVTCVGSLTTFKMRLANTPEILEKQGHFEIVSLVGTYAKEFSHIHMSVADNKGTMYGGHLVEGNIVYTTAEITLLENKDYIFKR